MYDTNSPQMELGKSDCKPDYEKMASILKKKLDVFNSFKASLVEFIQTIGMHSLRPEPSSLTELFGKVELDSLNYQKEYESLLSRIEKDS